MVPKIQRNGNKFYNKKTLFEFINIHVFVDKALVCQHIIN